MSTKYPGGFISSTEPTVSPLSAKGIWTLAEALRYKTAGEWPISPIYVGVQGVFATANVGQAESVIPVLLTGLQATGSVNDLTVIGSAIVALDAVTGTGGVGAVSISLPTVNDPYFNLNSMLLADSLANTFITDEGPNKFVITPNGDTRPSAFSPYNNGWSNYFDGSGDYLVPPTSDSFAYGTGDFTIECWVYLNSSGTYGIFGHGSGSSANPYFYINSTTPTLFFNNTSIATGPVVTVGAWTHLAVARSGTSLRVFTNGVSGTPATNSTNLTAGGPITIAGSSTAAQLLNGYISNLRVVKGTAVYTSNFTPPTASLTAVSGTSLLTCQSNRFIDNSTNAFTITKNGDVKVTSFAPFADTDTSTGAGYFDGNDTLSVPSDTNFAFGTGDFTVEGWFYQTSDNTYPSALEIGNHINSTGILFIVKNSGQAKIYSGGFYGGATTSLNQWNHIAWVRSSGSLQIYVNGTLGSTTSFTNNLTNAATIRIASDNAVNSSYTYTGYISNLRVIKGTAITPPSGGPTAPLTAVSGTSLLTLQHRVSYNNSQPIDESGLKNVITRNGNASVGSYSPYVPSGWSGYFDGTGDYISTTPSSSSLTFGTGDFTIEGLVYSNDVTSDKGIMQLSDAAGGLKATASGVISITTRFGVVRIFNAGTATSGGISVSVGSWFHFALVRSSGVVNLYVNGTKDTTFSDKADTTNYATTYAAIGGYESTSYLYNGYISNLRIVKGTALHTSNFTPPTAPLEPVAGTSLLTLRGPSFTDDGPNRFAITRNGDTKIAPFSPFLPQTVTPDSYSVYFDGSGDYLSLPSSSNLTLDGDFTIECFAYYNSDVANGTIFGTGGSPNWTLQRRDASNQLAFYDGTWHLFLATVPLSTWFHIAMVRSGSTITGYIDGVSVTSWTQASNINLSGGYICGQSGSAYPINGFISNFRLVKGTALYTSAFTPPTEPLTAVSGTSLLTCQSPTVIDNSTNDFAITVNGNSQPTKFNPFGETVTTDVEYTPAAHGGSVYFDGSADWLNISGAEGTKFGTTPFTVEGWFYVTNVSTAITLIWIYGSTLDLLRLQLNSTTGVVTIQMRATSLSLTSFSSSSPSLVLLNEWAHLAIVRNGTEMALYVNGVKTSTTISASAAWNEGATSAYRIGAQSNTDGQYLQGYSSGVRVVKGTAVYTANFVPPQAPVDPIPGTTLLTCDNNAAIYDYAGRNVLETVGNARTVQETPYRANHSVYFDGSGDYLQVPANSSFNISAGDFTIEGWFYAISNRPAPHLFQLGTSSGSRFNVFVSSGNLVLYVSGSYATNTAIPYDTWFHFALVKTGSNTSNVFLNGTLIYSSSSPSYPTGDLRLAIGWQDWGSSSNDYYTGYVSNFRIIKGTAVYTSNFTPPTEPLTAVSGTSLLTCNTYNFTDSSTNNFTITRNGDVKISSRGPFQQNEGDRCMYFDGSGDYLSLYDPIYQNSLGSGDSTFECWMYFDSLPSVVTALYHLKNDSALATTVFILEVTSGGAVSLSTGTAIIASGTAGKITTGAWIHFACVRTNGVFKTFFNGVQDISVSNTTTYNGTYVQLGAWRYSTYDYSIDGYLDDIRITKGFARYTANFDPPSEPLPKV